MTKRQKKKFVRKFHNKKFPDKRWKKILKEVQDEMGNDKDIVATFNGARSGLCGIFMIEPDFEVPEKYKSEGCRFVGHNLFQCDRFKKCYPGARSVE